MSNVIMAYIMEEKPSDPAKEGSINRSSCASEKGPFFFPVVRYCGVWVVEVCEHDCSRKLLGLEVERRNDGLTDPDYDALFLVG